MSEKKPKKKGVNALANTDGELKGVKAGPDAEVLAKVAGEEMPKKNKLAGKGADKGAEKAVAEADIPGAGQLDEMAKNLGAVLGVYQEIDFTSEAGQKKIKDWVSQFPAEQQLFILEELTNIFGSSFITTANIEVYLLSVIAKWKEEWKNTTLLDVQGDGKSQHDLVQKFLTKKQISVNDYGKNIFLYLDDALYTGNSLYQSLKALSADGKLKGKKVCVRVNFFHEQALTFCQFGEKLVNDAGGELQIKCRRSVQCLYGGFFSEDSHFTSDQNRIKLRDIFAVATKLLVADNEKFGVYGLKSTKFGLNLPDGFGSTIATYRNCPNGAPIALWWSAGG